MAKAKKSPATKPKKLLKKEVAGTSTEIFADLKQAVGEKKFSKKVKKATKILSAGALKHQTKKEDPAKKNKASKAAKEANTGKAAKLKDKKSKKDKKDKKSAKPVAPAASGE